MGFSDDLKAALGGYVATAKANAGDYAGALAAQGVALIQPYLKTGLDSALTSLGPSPPPPVGKPAGIDPGVYSARTPPPTAGERPPAEAGGIRWGVIAAGTAGALALYLLMRKKK
jgi:hypothetical protein